MIVDKFEHAGAVLSIDLDALADNWRLLQQRSGAAACAAVVKADAYGLGAGRVAPHLARAGCRAFFVAHLDEALSLRPLLPASCAVYVLHGVPPGAEADCLAGDAIPVLNSLAQVEAWRRLAGTAGRRLPALLQVDTGMARVGLAPAEVRRLATDPALLDGVEIRYVMSHLACAEEQGNPLNRVQLERFSALRELLPASAASLANSSGIFLGPDFHCQLTRPGAALYGVAPVAGQPNPMRPVIRLQGKVVQLREIDARTSVGYGASWVAPAPTRIATVAVGYADGFLRSLSSRASAWYMGVALPLVGKVSMDTITLDVSSLPADALHEGSLVDLINERHTIDRVAELAGTIGYEILTSLGQRYFRRYLGD